METLLAAIGPQLDDTLITLGDYVDRGPDSRGVIERLLRLKQQCRLVPLLGNHDQMVLKVYAGQMQMYIDWLMYGGSATLESYGATAPQDIPRAHIDFLGSCRLFYETDRHFYVHGNYRADLPLSAQPIDTAALGIGQGPPARPASLGQDRHRGPFLAKERRNPRPGVSQVYRHLVLRRGLADGD